MSRGRSGVPASRTRCEHRPACLGTRTTRHAASVCPGRVPGRTRVRPRRPYRLRSIETCALFGDDGRRIVRDVWVDPDALRRAEPLHHLSFGADVNDHVGCRGLPFVAEAGRAARDKRGEQDCDAGRDTRSPEDNPGIAWVGAFHHRRASVSADSEGLVSAGREADGYVAARPHQSSRIVGEGWREESVLPMMRFWVLLITWRRRQPCGMARNGTWAWLRSAHIRRHIPTFRLP